MFVSSFTYGQIFSQTFVDRCTGETKIVTANFSQGSAVVSFYSRVRVFTYQEFLQGQLQSWLAETYNWWNTLSPCSDAAQQAQQAQQTAQQAQQAAQQAQQAATNASTAATNATQAATTASTAATTASTAASTASTAATTASTAGTTASTATTGTSQTTTTNTGSTNTTNTSGGTTNDTSTTNTTGDTSSSGGSSSTDSSSSTDTGSSSSGEGTTSNDSSGTTEGGTESSGESSSETKTDETKTEETKTEETKSEEKTEEVKEETKEETKEESKEETKEEEKKEEEKTEEKEEEKKEEDKDEETKEEKEEEEKGEKKKEKVKMMPIQLKADAMAMQTPLGSYNAVMNIGASQSSIFGDVSYSLNTMIWDNLKQVSFMGARTKIAFTDDYQVKIIKATAVGYSNNYSISTLMLSQSFMKPFKNGMTVGVGISAGTTFESFPIKENFMVSYNVLATKSFKLNDRITYSPALIFTQTPFMSSNGGVGVDFNNGNPFGVSVKNEMKGSRIHFMGIMANSFTVQLTKRFSFNAGWTIIKGSDPNLPMMHSFMIGSKLPF